MKRREFITALAGASVSPLVAVAQQAERMRRIGVLMSTRADDPEGKARIAAFLQGLHALGWTDGSNVRIDIRWAAGDADRIRTYAMELVGLAPDVIFAHTTAVVTPLQQVTRTIPIVFALATDPVGAGIVDSFARPGRNATGFIMFDYGMSAKWLELLKQIVPTLTRAAILRDPINPAGLGQFGALQSVAPSFGVELTAISLDDADEIDRAIATFSRSPNSGLIVVATSRASIHREMIIRLAARHKMPAVYFARYFVAREG